VKTINVLLFLTCVLCAPVAFCTESSSDSNAAGEAFRASYASEKSMEYEEAIKAILPLKETPALKYVVNVRLGWLYYLNASYANSRNAYQTALKTTPGSIEAKLGYMLPVLAQGNFDEAELIAKQIIEVDKLNYYANLRMAYALRMQRKFLDAEKIDTQMLQYFPSDVTLLTELALAKVGQNRPAKKIFNDILTLDPDNATAKYYIEKFPKLQ